VKVKAKAASPDRAESRDQYHHGDLKNALIAAAEGLLEEKGAKELSLRECARRVGVTPTAVAHHFGNVSGLVTAVATVSFTDLAKLLRAALKRSALNGSDSLEAICEAYLKFAERKPARYKIMFSDANRDRSNADYNAASLDAFEILRDTIKTHAGNSGRVGAEDAWAPRALFVWSALHGFASLENARRLELLKAPLRSETDADLRRKFLNALLTS
jgi:AcrR family transcriptional regulator